MSFLGIRLMGPQQLERTRHALRESAIEALKLFRWQQRLRLAFRCACMFVDNMNEDRLHLRHFVEMGVMCRWATPSESESFSVEPDAVRQLSDALNSDESFVTGGSKEEQDRLFFMLKKIERCAALDRQSSMSKVLPMWRDPSTVASTYHRDKGLAASCLQKRTIRSTAAMHNLLQSLSSRDSRPPELLPVTSASLREAFAFVIGEARDECNQVEFAMLVIMAAQHFFADDAEDLGAIGVLDILWNASLGAFAKEYSLHQRADIELRLPLGRFPGMSAVQERYTPVLRRIYTILGGGGPMNVSAVRRLVHDVGFQLEFPHFSDDQIDMCFYFSMKHYDPPADGVTSPLPLAKSITFDTVDQFAMELFAFFDCCTMMGLHLFCMEPFLADAPTVASKLEMFLRRCQTWYHAQLGRTLITDILPPRSEPPQIISIIPMKVSAHTRSSVTLVGKMFPVGGVIVKFGSLLMISSGASADSGSFTVDVPPTNTTHTDVLILKDDGDVVCTVRHFRDVDVAVSIDGCVFHKFETDTPFRYEHVELPVSIRSYLPRLTRMFIHCASDGGTRAQRELIDKEAWLTCAREYRMIPRVVVDEQREDGAQQQAIRLVSQCFEQYATEVPVGEKGVPTKLMSCTNFQRCFLAWIVHSGTPLRVGLEEMLDNDQWLERESLPDVPEVLRGPHAFRIRRAASHAAVVRRPPDTVKAVHINSPRSGKMPLTETEALDGCDAIVATSRMPAGRWTNEVDHSRMVYRFQQLGDSDAVEESFGGMSKSLGSSSSSRLNAITEHSVGEAFHASSSLPKQEDAATAIHRATQKIVLQSHRDQHNAARRREKSSEDRHQLQMLRIQRELSEAKAQVASLEDNGGVVASTQDAPILAHNTGDGVLQAEKEELHRIFVFELEKRRQQLLKEGLNEQSLRDLERDRVMRHAREQIVDVESSCTRLQEIVTGQSQTILKQNEIVKVLNTRSTVLMADVMYFRSAHEKALSMMREDAEYTDVVGTLQVERTQHDTTVNLVHSEMMSDAKSEGKKHVPTIKELAKMTRVQSRKVPTAISPHANTESQPRTPGAAVDTEFKLGRMNSLANVTLTVAEADSRQAIAISEVEEKKNKEIEELSALLTAAQEAVKQAEVEHAVLDSRLAKTEEYARAAKAQAAEATALAAKKAVEAAAAIAAAAATALALDDRNNTPYGLDHTQTGDTRRLSDEEPLRIPSFCRKPSGVAPLLSVDILSKSMREVDVQTDPPPEDAPSPAAQEESRISAGYFVPDAVIVHHNIAATDSFDSIAAMYGTTLQDIFDANFIIPPDESLTADSRAADLALTLKGLVTGHLRVPVRGKMLDADVALTQHAPVITQPVQALGQDVAQIPPRQPFTLALAAQPLITTPVNTQLSGWSTPSPPWEQRTILPTATAGPSIIDFPSAPLMQASVSMKVSPDESSRMSDLRVLSAQTREIRQQLLTLKGEIGQQPLLVFSEYSEQLLRCVSAVTVTRAATQRTTTTTSLSLNGPDDREPLTHHVTLPLARRQHPRKHHEKVLTPIEVPTAVDVGHALCISTFSLQPHQVYARSQRETVDSELYQRLLIVREAEDTFSACRVQHDHLWHEAIKGLDIRHPLVERMQKDTHRFAFAHRQLLIDNGLRITGEQLVQADKVREAHDAAIVHSKERQTAQLVKSQAIATEGARENAALMEAVVARRGPPTMMRKPLLHPPLTGLDGVTIPAAATKARLHPIATSPGTDATSRSETTAAAAATLQLILSSAGKLAPLIVSPPTVPPPPPLSKEAMGLLESVARAELILASKQKEMVVKNVQ